MRQGILELSQKQDVFVKDKFPSNIQLSGEKMQSFHVESWTDRWTMVKQHALYLLIQGH